jgi:copper chaperone CopZ
MVESNYTVAGMTCAHCVAAVKQELGAIAGVHEVDVDLDSGRVRIVSDSPLAEGDVWVAVDEAGYEVVP